jgi:filamentous hemagglutinin family protein
MRNRQPWRPSLGVATGVLAGLLTAAAHAGDLLRGGAAFGQRNGAAAQQPGAAAAAAAKANAADILARTTQAVQSVQNLQQAANNLSQSANNAGLNPKTGATLPNVPNGLTPGGLQVAPGATPGSSLWQGANLPTQSTSGGNTNVSITQFQPTAILNWTTFNIGSHTKLQFDQDLAGGQTSEWIAFNIVNDPSGVPSQILGSIQANGQVFVVNRNGIIFGGGSQVNTHALFASSLPINNSLITSGLLVNPSAQFLFSSGTFASNSAFTAPATPDGDVLVEAGAQITSPTSAAHVGGRVVLAGPNVTNDGTITTPDGQTILAAGQQVGFQAHPGSDPTLRGLDAYVGAVTPGSGTATNNGII